MPRAPPGLILPPHPACAYLIHQLHPVWRDLLLPALAAGRSRAEPEAGGQTGGKEQVPRHPDLTTMGITVCPLLEQQHPPNPQPCSFASPAARSVLDGGSIASRTFLRRAAHPQHHPWHYPSCPSCSQLSSLQAAPARPRPPSPAGTGSFGHRGCGGGQQGTGVQDQARQSCTGAAAGGSG